MRTRATTPTVHKAVVIAGGALAVVFDPFAERDGPTEPEPPTGPALIDSCPVEGQNDIGSYGVDQSMDACYQAFTLAKPTILRSAKVSLKAVGGPFGGIVLGLYMSSGAFPNVKPSGSYLFPSFAVDVAEISTGADGGLVEFQFPTPGDTPAAPGTYCLSVEKQYGGVFSVGKVMVGYNFDFGRKGKAARAGAAHYGNGGYHQAGMWGVDDMADMIFYLYGDPQ
jgi:hypothetical protein